MKTVLGLFVVGLVCSVINSTPISRYEPNQAKIYFHNHSNRQITSQPPTIRPMIENQPAAESETTTPQPIAQEPTGKSIEPESNESTEQAPESIATTPKPKPALTAEQLAKQKAAYLNYFREINKALEKFIRGLDKTKQLVEMRSNPDKDNGLKAIQSR